MGSVILVIGQVRRRQLRRFGKGTLEKPKDAPDLFLGLFRLRFG